MKFSEFATYLEVIEQTASRNEMTDLLVSLIKKLDDQEIDKGVYLLLGRLRPQFDSLEFALADKQVIKAIARAFKVEEDEVKTGFKLMGDLGKTAEKMVVIDVRDGITVCELHAALTAIALDGGVGSQDRKIDALAKVMEVMDAKSVKYLTRIVLGKLRLGFSDKTVIDALSVMEVGSKDIKDKLEIAYQVRPDIGWLAREVKTKGWKQAVGGVGVALGTPMMVMLAARLKSADEMIKKMGVVAIEPKFDGTRVQIHFDRNGKDWQFKTYTRNLEETTWMFPELTKMGECVNANELVLDCEAIGFDPETGTLLNFQTTITRKRKHGIEDQAIKIPLKFFVFDVMYKDGESLIGLDYEARRKILKETIPANDLLVVDDFQITRDAKEIVTSHQKMIDKGLEGIIVKRIDSAYVPGRTGWRWVKMKEAETSLAKLSDTIDAVVMGFYKGQGKRTQFGIGAFLVGIKNKDKYVTIAKIGTGLSDEQFRELKSRLDVLISAEMPEIYDVDKNLYPDVWVEPNLVVEIAADEVTKSPIHSAGVALRFPRLVKFRDDKNADGATELSEIEQMKAA
jgi:DNA ligase-1